ncbi:MAG: hypothetical protein WC145_06405 [Aliarcobacter sp.]
MAIVVTWDTTEELQDWILDGLEVVDGYLQPLEGVQEGTATLPVTCFAGLTAPTRIELADIERPSGCGVFTRFRSGATSGECSSADWSPWFDVVYTDGTCIVDTGSYYLNNVDVPMGQYWQIEVLLRRD